MDCWFELETTGRYDYVYDREENKNLSLPYGLALLDEGLTDLSDYDLTKKEQECYVNLLKKVGVRYVRTYKYTNGKQM